MLTKEEQTQLASYYRNRDLYDPSKAKEQMPPKFKPQGLADGGFPDVSQIDDGSIEKAPDQNEGKRLTKEDPVMKDSLVNGAKPHVEIPDRAEAATVVTPTIQKQDAQTNKLDKSQYDELIAKLSQGSSVRQMIGSGLAGLGDAIVQGVSRAGNPGFQQHAIDRQKMQQEALANALRSKYEAGFKAQELGQGQQRLTDENTRAKDALAGENTRAAAALKESGRQHDLEMQRAQSGQAIEANKAKMEQDLKTVHDYGSFTTGGPSKEVFKQAMARLEGAGNAHPQDSNAVAWAQSHPTDLRAAKILKANGY